MIVSVRQPKPGVFILTVTGSHHRHDFDLEFNSMDRVWCAAREVSETEIDFLENQYGKEW